MRSIVVAVLALGSFCVSSISHAQAPDSLSFQGFVTDIGGIPVDTPGVSMTFKLYEGSSEIWTETQPSVEIEGGVFNVFLGSVTPLDTVRFNRPLSLGIKVGLDPEISPRTPMAAAAYAKALPGFYTYYSENGAGQQSYNVVGGASVNFVGAGVTGATIGGGGDNRVGVSTRPNKVLNDFGVIGGGSLNTVSANIGTIGGGLDNTAGGLVATVAGGWENLASGYIATVGGGQLNTAEGQYATVAGGLDNLASGYIAAVSGGQFNTARGNFATVPGGSRNSARGYLSFAAGSEAKALHRGTFVWNDRSQTAGDLSDSLFSTGDNQFLIRAAGGVGVGTNAPTAQLHVVGAGDTSGGVVGFPEVVSRFQRDAGQAGHTAVSIDAKTGKDAVLYFAENGSAAWDLRYDEGTDRMQFRYHTGGVNATALEIAGDASLKFVRPGSDNAFSLGLSDRKWTEVWATNGTINTSDRRLKRDIEDIESGLDAVMDLRPVRFHWIDNPTANYKLGLIAQEVESVVPEVVRAPKNDGEHYGLNYAELVPVLIKAIQEQQAKAEAQQAQIDDLLAAYGDQGKRLAAIEARLQP